MNNKQQKPWGFEGTIVSNDFYSGRIIVVLQGERTAYGCHKKRDKTLFILQGIVKLIVEGTTRTLQEGERYHIRPNAKHQVEAIKGDATVLDIGTKFDEEDWIE